MSIYRTLGAVFLFYLMLFAEVIVFYELTSLNIDSNFYNRIPRKINIANNIKNKFIVFVSNVTEDKGSRISNQKNQKSLELIRNETLGNTIHFNVSMQFIPTKLNVLYGSMESGNLSFLNENDNKSIRFISRYDPIWNSYNLSIEMIFTGQYSNYGALKFVVKGYSNATLSVTLRLYNYSAGLYQKVSFKNNITSLDFSYLINLSAWSIEDKIKIKFQLLSSEKFSLELYNAYLEKNNLLVAGHYKFETPTRVQINVTFLVSDNMKIIFNNISRFYRFRGVWGSWVVWNFSERSIYIVDGGEITVFFDAQNYWQFKETIPLAIKALLANKTVNDYVIIKYRELMRNITLIKSGFYYIGNLEIVNKYNYELKDVPVEISLNCSWFNLLSINNNLSDLAFACNESGQLVFLKSLLIYWDGAKAIFIVNIPHMAPYEHKEILLLFSSDTKIISHNNLDAKSFGNAFGISNFSYKENWLVTMGDIYTEYYAPPINKSRITLVYNPETKAFASIFKLNFTAHVLLKLFVYFLEGDIKAINNNVTIIFGYLNEVKYMFVSLINTSNGYEILGGIKYYGNTYIFERIKLNTTNAPNQVNIQLNFDPDDRQVMIQISDEAEGIFVNMTIPDYFNFIRNAWHLGFCAQGIYSVAFDILRLRWSVGKIIFADYKYFSSVLNITLVEQNFSYGAWEVLGNNNIIPYHINSKLEIIVQDYWNTTLCYMIFDPSDVSSQGNVTLELPIRGNIIELLHKPYQSVIIARNGFYYNINSDKILVGYGPLMIVIHDPLKASEYHIILNIGSTREGKITLDLTNYEDTLLSADKYNIMFSSLGEISVFNNTFVSSLIKTSDLTSIINNTIFHDWNKLISAIKSSIPKIESELNNISLILETFNISSNYTLQEVTFDIINNHVINISISSDKEKLLQNITGAYSWFVSKLGNLGIYSIVKLFENLVGFSSLNSILNNFKLQISRNHLKMRIYSENSIIAEASFYMNSMNFIYYQYQEKTFGSLTLLKEAFDIISLLNSALFPSVKSDLFANFNLQKELVSIDNTWNVTINLDLGYLIMSTKGNDNTIYIDREGSIYVGKLKIQDGTFLILRDMLLNGHKLIPVENESIETILLREIVVRKVQIVDIYSLYSINLDFLEVTINNTLKLHLATASSMVFASLKGPVDIIISDNRFDKQLLELSTENITIVLKVKLGYLFLVNMLDDALVAIIGIKNSPKNITIVLEPNSTTMLILPVMYQYDLRVYYSETVVFNGSISLNGSLNERPVRTIIFSRSDNNEEINSTASNETVGTDNKKNFDSSALRNLMLYSSILMLGIVISIFVVRKVVLSRRKKDIISAEEVLRKILKASQEDSSNQ